MLKYKTFYLGNKYMFNYNHIAFEFCVSSTNRGAKSTQLLVLGWFNLKYIILLRPYSKYMKKKTINNFFFWFKYFILLKHHH